MVITITATVGSVLMDKDAHGWCGTYDVCVWYKNDRYRKSVEFNALNDFDDIPKQGDGVLVNFDTVSKDIILIN